MWSPFRYSHLDYSSLFTDFKFLDPLIQFHTTLHCNLMNPKPRSNLNHFQALKVPNLSLVVPVLASDQFRLDGFVLNILQAKPCVEHTASDNTGPGVKNILQATNTAWVWDYLINWHNERLLLKRMDNSAVN